MARYEPVFGPHERTLDSIYIPVSASPRGKSWRLLKGDSSSAIDFEKAVNCIEKAVDCIEKAVDCIEKAVDCIEKAVDCIEKAVNCIEKAVDCIEKAVDCIEKVFLSNLSV